MRQAQWMLEAHADLALTTSRPQSGPLSSFDFLVGSQVCVLLL
jgi:hypothetical protein